MTALPDAVADRRFLAILGLYFAAQAALRIALGRSLNLDEAEMILLAREWAWGYGPQLPLYNWIQTAAFDVLGLGIPGLAIPKNIVLWIGYAGLFTGLRQVVPFGQAVAGTLSLILLPNVLWEFQRASTHSIALLASITWMIAALFAVLSYGRWRDYAALGVTVGLGCLAKANFSLIAISLLIAAAALSRTVPVPLKVRGLLLAGVLAALMVARPLLWVYQNPQLAFASTAKLYVPQPMILGLAETFVGLAAGLVFVALAVWLLLRAGRGRATVGARWPGQVLLLSGTIGFAIWIAGLILAGVSTVESRWMVPIMVPFSAGAMLLAARRASPRALRILSWSACGLGIVTLIGMAEMRLMRRNSGAVEFEPLAALTDRLKPAAVLANYYAGGNLAMLRPGLTVLTPHALRTPLPDGPVLFLDVQPVSPQVADAALAMRGMAALPGKTREEGVVSLRYSSAPAMRTEIYYLLTGP